MFMIYDTGGTCKLVPVKRMIVIIILTFNSNINFIFYSNNYAMIFYDL